MWSRRNLELSGHFVLFWPPRSIRSSDRHETTWVSSASSSSSTWMCWISKYHQDGFRKLFRKSKNGNSLLLKFDSWKCMADLSSGRSADRSDDRSALTKSVQRIFYFWRVWPAGRWLWPAGRSGCKLWLFHTFLPPLHCIFPPSHILYFFDLQGIQSDSFNHELVKSPSHSYNHKSMH